MNTCAGCGYEFASTAEVFGGIGEAFCVSCYQEEIGLVRPRKRFEAERDEIIFSIAVYGTSKKRCEELESIEENLSTLTVAYQRKFSVIGRLG